MLGSDESLQGETADTKPLMQYAIGLLAKRELPSADLQAKLRMRFPEQTALITDVLDALQANGYQSDARYVDAVCRQKIANCDGPQKIMHFLRTKGVDPCYLDQWVEDNKPNWRDLIADILVKRYGGKSAPCSMQDKQKITRYLANKGFYNDDIFSVLSTNE